MHARAGRDVHHTLRRHCGNNTKCTGTDMDTSARSRTQSQCVQGLVPVPTDMGAPFTRTCVRRRSAAGSCMSRRSPLRRLLAGRGRGSHRHRRLHALLLLLLLQHPALEPLAGHGRGVFICGVHRAILLALVARLVPAHAEYGIERGAYVTLQCSDVELDEACGSRRTCPICATLPLAQRGGVRILVADVVTALVLGMHRKVGHIAGRCSHGKVIALPAPWAGCWSVCV